MVSAFTINVASVAHHSRTFQSSANSLDRKTGGSTPDAGRSTAELEARLERLRHDVADAALACDGVADALKQAIKTYSANDRDSGSTYRQAAAGLATRRG